VRRPKRIAVSFLHLDSLSTRLLTIWDRLIPEFPPNRVAHQKLPIHNMSRMLWIGNLVFVLASARRAPVGPVGIHRFSNPLVASQRSGTWRRCISVAYPKVTVPAFVIEDAKHFALGEGAHLACFARHAIDLPGRRCAPRFPAPQSPNEPV
jgi:hypothetical protein